MMDIEGMNILTIIPVRGGSKGIPRKNVLPLAGKPLIAHTIQQAQQSPLINRVVVSTDDPEIAAISQKYGAEIIWRPEEISGDTASSESALLHSLEVLNQTENYQPDLLVFLQCTSPLTLAEDIDGTIQVLLSGGADSALAVIPFHYYLWHLSSSGDAVGINHDKGIRPLRQDREPQYLETGAVYVMQVKGFLEAKHRFFGKTAIYIMPAERRLEIDEPVDFEVAELLMRGQIEKKGLEALPSEIQAVVFDFDGVFTDNKALVMQNGQEAVFINRGDGMGIRHMRESGLQLLILSTERNPVVQVRAEKLGITCIHGVHDKWSVLKDWLDSMDIDPQKTVYVGNDINDLPVMTHVGCAVAVSDAHPSVIDNADLIMSRAGGDGSIRELSDLILKKIDLLD